MKALVAFGKAIADPTRARILNALRRSELCVCELVDALEISQSTLSTHLQTLRIAGVVETQKRGTWILYRIAPDALESIEALFQRFGPPDSRTERDLERVEARLGIRVDGECVLGSGQLDTETVGGSKR